MKNLGAEQVKVLLAELAQLHERQLETIKAAAFIPMSSDQWELYEARVFRIREIGVLLGRP